MKFSMIEIILAAIILIVIIILSHTYDYESDFKQKCEAAGGIKISVGNGIRCFNKSTFIELK